MFRRKEAKLQSWTRDIVLATGRVARCEWMPMPDKASSKTIVSGWVTIPNWLTEGERAEITLALEKDPLVSKVLTNPGKRAV